MTSKPVPKLLVVVTAKFPWEDEAHVVTHGVLENPAAEGQDGDAAQAVLRTTQNYQCDGHSPDTGNCKQLHAHATERVIARCVQEGAKGPDGEPELAARVVWRRFHPTVAPIGTAAAGRPYEARDDEGMILRVEARKVVDDGSEAPAITDRTVNMVQLRMLEAQFKAEEAHLEVRTQINTALAMFDDVQYKAAREQLEECAVRFSSLPWQQEIRTTLARAEAEVAAIRGELVGKAKELCRAENLGAPQAQQLQAAVPEFEQRMKLALRPLGAIEQRGRDLLKIQDQIRDHIKSIGEIEEALVKRRDAELPTLDVTKVPFAKARGNFEALLKETQAEADADALTRFQQAIDRAEASVEELRAAAGQAVEVENQKKLAFEARIRLVELWRSGHGAAWLETYTSSAAGYPGFALAFWQEKARAAGAEMMALPALGALRYFDDGDRKRLEEAEGKMRPLLSFLERLEADMVRRGKDGGMGARFEVHGLQIAAPTAWVRVNNVRPGNRVDMSVHVRNNDARPIEVALCSGDDTVDKVTLGPRGRTATFNVEDVNGPFHFVVTAVGTDGVGARGEPKMIGVDVPSIEIDPRYEGELRHVPAYAYTPSKEQPAKREHNAKVDQEQTTSGRPVGYQTLPVPGESGRAQLAGGA